MRPERLTTESPLAESGPADQRTEGSSSANGSVARGVITELNLLRDWIKDGSGYNRDDAPDEIARAIANRIREIEVCETTKPLNND